MLFQAVSPFEIYGVSAKPLWIAGRRTRPPPPPPPPSLSSSSQQEPSEYDRMRTVKLESEMLYVTSISWKAQGQGYHGFVDDVLFIGFSIEDSATGVIDVVAGDLVDGLALCVYSWLLHKWHFLCCKCVKERFAHFSKPTLVKVYCLL
ncbi:uncharacterized protein BDW70DRAFT_164910 [Aspergillus foveolatus]|uniref:uncharacterized protein n=1 Tax=Aspergillus foveolatus TaxID=210207 RepID=UPI003CCD98FC